MPPRQKKPGACVRCRQMKFGCDAPKLFPASCSRCVKQKIRCSIDPSFKPVPKKERLKALERELRDIKQRLGSPPAQDALRSIAPLSPGTSSHVETGDLHQASPAPIIVEPVIHRHIVYKTIGDVELDASCISNLLKEYYSNYHQQFPLIVEGAAVLDTYDSCPLLFWTVMTIAARDSTQHRHLYHALTNAVQSLASTVCPPSRQSLSLIQALLLLCYWPLPFDASTNDCSWTYCGLATTYSLQQGLHRPFNISDFSYNAICNEATMNDRRKTWLACFIVNQRMSTRFGLPAISVADHSILEAMANKPAWLPDTLYHQLHIAYQGSRICSVLGNCEITATGLLPSPAPIIQMFDTELRAQEARFASSWKNNEYIFFLATKLHLYSFALSNTGLESSNSEERRTETFSHAYLTAMNLLQSALDLSAEQTYWTQHQLRNIVDAVYFLLKLGGASYEFVDEAAAKNVIGQVWQLLRSRSQSEDDHASRVCSVIEYLSHKHWKREAHASVSVKSRMAGNLTIDSVWCARDRFSETVKAQRPIDYTSAAGIEKSLEGLDDQSWLSFFGEGVGDWDSVFQNMNVESLLGSMDGT